MSLNRHDRERQLRAGQFWSAVTLECAGTRYPVPMSVKLPKPERSLVYLEWIGVTALALVLAIEVWLSLEWRLLQDSPLLHYVAFLIAEHDYVPYRDIFETSMPGTFLFHLAIVTTVGYSDLAFRLVDTGMLLTAMLLAWSVMRRIDLLVATAGVLTFALMYLGYGQGMSLQRDFVGFVPVIAALWIVVARPVRADLAAALVGLLCGLASTIKPHLAIGGPVLLVYMAFELRATGQIVNRDFWPLLLRLFIGAGVALLLAVSLPLLWLWKIGGLAAFWELLTGYLPLHVDMTGNMATVTASEKLRYIASRLGRDLFIWAPPTLLGLYIALRYGPVDADRRRLIWLLAALLACYAVYPVFAAQFWLYHWMPFRILACLATALLLLPLRTRFWPGRYAAAAVFAFVAGGWSGFICLTAPPAICLPRGFAEQFRGAPAPPPKNGLVDELAELLTSYELAPGDKVQPADWTNGAIHAMLLAKTPIATPYLYDYHFYHYVSDPVVQELRRRFMADLQDNPPRLFIDMDNQSKPIGLDTTDSFPELEEFVRQNYRVLYEGDSYRILELDPNGGAEFIR